METQTALTHKCPLCKGQKVPQEFLSADGQRTVKTCKTCRERVGNWKRDNPEAVQASIERQGPNIRARAKAWYEGHPEQAKASSKTWREANPEKMRTYYAKWRSDPQNDAKAKGWIAAWMKAHPEKVRGYYKRWYIENQDALRFLVDQRRRAYKTSNFTFDDWATTLEVFGHCCAYCLRGDVKLTMDHVIPISKGGEHTADNVVPACKPCNSKKNDRPIFLIVGKAA